MQKYRYFILLGTLLLAGCSLYEETRIVDRTEKELARNFATTPDVLSRSTYGGLEEGGDVALIKLSDSDCSALRHDFAQTRQVQPNTREYDTFRNLDLTPSTVSFGHWTDNAGADTVYLLDNASCVLYRQAHFE